MRNIIAIFFFIIQFSCIEKKNGYQKDCNSEQKKAQNDFKYKNYTWTDIRGLSFGLDAITLKELSKRLVEFDIKLDSINLSCFILPNDKYENCYAKEMNSLLEKKFGKTFFKEQTNLAIKDYVLANSEQAFEYEDSDQISKYPNSTIENQFDKIELDYFKRYPIPKNYIEKSIEEEYFSNTSAYFILTKEGKVKDLSIENNFQNKENEVFDNIFKKQIKDFILNTDWIPAKIQGVDVNSYYGITIHYK